MSRQIKSPVLWQISLFFLSIVSGQISLLTGDPCEHTRVWGDFGSRRDANQEFRIRESRSGDYLFKGREKKRENFGKIRETLAPSNVRVKLYFWLNFIRGRSFLQFYIVLEKSGKEGQETKAALNFPPSFLLLSPPRFLDINLATDASSANPALQRDPRIKNNFVSSFVPRRTTNFSLTRCRKAFERRPSAASGYSDQAAAWFSILAIPPDFPPLSLKTE